MIPMTYDQVRVEQGHQLARMELRRHEKAAQRARQQPQLERARPLATHGRRAAVAICGLLAAALALAVF